MDPHFFLIIPPVTALGSNGQYFWLLQKWLYSFRGRPTTIVLPEHYLEYFKDQSRWEFGEWSCRYHQYRPSTEVDDTATPVFFDPDETRQADAMGPAKRFVQLIRFEKPSLVAFYRKAIESARTRAGAEVVVVAWLNDHSLRAAARATGCRLVFNELGPLRAPYYRQTAYWDGHGVNAETQIATLWRDEKQGFADWQTRRNPGGTLEIVQDLLAAPEAKRILRVGAERFPLGLALQVETDSNLLAYSKGWDSLSLIECARASSNGETPLLRMHPGGRVLYPGTVDLARSPLEFLSKVREVWTINSSLAAEALFWGKGLRLFGENPIELVFDLPANERSSFLVWFFLRYLIPYDLLFDAAYYSWRLANPPVEDIVERHVAFYRREQDADFEPVAFPDPLGEGAPGESFCPDPHQAIAELDRLRRKVDAQAREIKGLESALYPLTEELRSTVKSHEDLTEAVDTLPGLAPLLDKVSTFLSLPKLRARS